MMFLWGVGVIPRVLRSFRTRASTSSHMAWMSALVLMFLVMFQVFTSSLTWASSSKIMIFVDIAQGVRVEVLGFEVVGRDATLVENFNH